MSNIERSYIAAYHICDNDISKIAQNPMFELAPEGWLGNCISWLQEHESILSDYDKKGARKRS